MKKVLLLAGVLCGALCFNSCGDDEVAKKYEVTITVTADGKDIKTLSDFSVTAQNEAGSSVTVEETEPQSFTYTAKVVAGTYTITAFACDSTYNFNGSKTIIVADQDVKESLVLTPSAKEKSGIIFKEVYFHGVPSYYFKDAFYELVNNSDEVQYLDGIILSTVSRGYGSTMSSWAQDTIGTLPADYYPFDGYVMMFPGNGTEYPLQPGQSTLIATQAYDHSSANRELGDADVESPAGDLSKADWELNIPSKPTNYENPDVPSLEVIWAGSSTIVFMPAVFGAPLMLAKLPNGVSAEAFVNDSTNYHSAPGTTKPVLCIPCENVIDAIDIQRYGESNIVKVFHPAQDAGYTMAQGKADDGTYPEIESLEDWISPLYSGKSYRRKCTMVTSDGRAYFKDTNNSTNDFIMGGQIAQPRRTFTQPD